MRHKQSYISSLTFTLFAQQCAAHLVCYHAVIRSVRTCGHSGCSCQCVDIGNCNKCKNMTMKRRRNVEEEVSQNGKKARNEHISDSKMTELLKRCLQKVCELQADLARESDEEDDAEAAGYAACAVETLNFLTAEGLPPNHPMVRGLEERLMNARNGR